jgi:hypothetical protein
VSVAQDVAAVNGFMSHIWSLNTAVYSRYGLNASTSEVFVVSVRKNNLLLVTDRLLTRS